MALGPALVPLTERDCARIGEWRRACREALRTPFMLGDEHQARFFRDVVCNRDAPARYWGIRGPHGSVVGACGLMPIQWENGLAEISLILDPAARGRGYGRAAVLLCLEEAFERLRLLTVCGECYHCNEALHFWRRLIAELGGTSVVLPRRTFWQGRLWDADYLTFTCEAWERRLKARTASSRPVLGFLHGAGGSGTPGPRVG